MNATMHIRDQLLEELELAVRTSEALIRRIEPGQWDYRPQDNMRSLAELVRHLALIPASDLTILKESPQQEVEGVERSLDEVTDSETLALRLRSHFEEAKRYFTSLPEEELLYRSTKAFYAEHGAVQIRWLIEMVTHMFHHRSQLYNYLKQLGHELQFFVLYA